ncbi:2-hydroxyacyl-CoA dehydratase family protein [bacterium]|nr:2-hydroxyacyl-CoA dehydratase family protein [bacterium]
MITRRIQYEVAGRVVGPMLMSLQNWQADRKRRARKPKENPFGPPFECLRKLKDIMSIHYLKGRYADGAVPVAWVTSGFPVEVLRPLGYHCVYPENHAAICGVQRLTPELSDAVEKEGYSRDLCSYARADIGCVITGKTPVGRLPRPDLLACCTNICQTVLYWYRSLAEYFGCPLVLIDTPYLYGPAKPHQLEYVKDQLMELIDVAEKVAGKKVDMEELAKVVELARDGTKLWGDCLATATAKPSPWTGIDGFFHIAPIVALRGTQECNAYYRLLLDELKDRVQKGVGGIKNEKYRLLWDNLPIWYNTRDLSTKLANEGFNFVVTTYTNAWAEAGAQIDPADPWNSAARSYTYIILNQDLNNRLQIMNRLARTYSVDGAILHSDRSCKPYSIGQLDLKERMSRELGIRVLVLEADHNDPRAWSAEQGDTRVGAFMESFA